MASTSSTGRPRRCWFRGWRFAIAAVAMTLGCGGGGHIEDLGEIASVAELGGRLSHSADVVVVPDRFWETADDGARWEFRGYAGLLCEVRTDSLDELRFVLQPAEASRPLHYMVKWDGERLWSRPRRLDDPESVIRVPPEKVTRGRHTLTVRRVASADEAADRSRIDNVFDGLAFEIGTARTWIDPEQSDRLEMLRAFLEDGVTGSGRQKRGGWLMVGPQRAELRLQLDEPATASFAVQSVTGSEGRFEIDVDGTVGAATAGVEPVPLEVPLPAGRSVIRFAVDGAADGLHLWAAPRLVVPDPAARTGPVVLLTLDTTRVDALSIYGGPEQASPAVAELAARATVFDNAWAVSPWTLPSHASIFTGQYPSRHGAGVRDPRLVAGVPTLAEVYRRAGYRTAGFAGGEMTASHWGVAQGFEAFYDPEGFETRGDRLTELAEAFMVRAAGQPFFLFVNYFDPHAAYEAPAEQQRLFGVAERRQRLPEGSVWAELARGKGGMWRKIVHEEVEIPEGAVDYLTAAYHAEVAFMDLQIGRLMDRLTDLGLYDDATIVLVADHGEFLGEHGFFSHGCRLEPELTHVPLIIKWPGQRQARRVDTLVSQVDLAPTLLAHAGLQPLAVDGLDLGSESVSESHRRTEVFMEEHESRIHPLIEKIMIAPHLFALQRLEDREVFWEGGGECFARGPEGWAARPCDVEWQRRLEEVRALTKWSRRLDRDDAPGPLSDDMRERLEALGYVH